MIHGAKHWNDLSRYYVQTNNPTEEILRKRSDGNWLVSCGPSAAVGCLAAMGHPISIKCPGRYQPQPEETLMDYFNDPRKYKNLQRARPEINPAEWHGNEIPQFYTIAVPEVFGVDADFRWCNSINKVATELFKGHAVQLNLETPGHYIAAVAWDDQTREIIFNDPWPVRFPNKDGFNRRMSEEEFRTNTKPFIIVYGGKIK